jgi:hypothetical protein
MPTLAHLLFGGAIAILIAIVLVLFLPGSQESRPQRRRSYRHRCLCCEGAHAREGALATVGGVVSSATTAR